MGFRKRGDHAFLKFLDNLETKQRRQAKKPTIVFQERQEYNFECPLCRVEKASGNRRVVRIGAKPIAICRQCYADGPKEALELLVQPVYTERQ
jgi:transcription elongation factor Elf1